MGTIVLIILYFLPTIIATLVGNKQLIVIFILNLLMGWTIFGWIVALMVSFDN